MKTIVITVPTYYPLKDGVQNITEYYAENLAKKYKVHVITEWREPLQREEDYCNVHITRVRVESHRIGFNAINEEDAEQVAGYLKEADVIINVCLQTALTDFSLPLLGECKAYKILHMHGMAEFSFPQIPKITMHDLIRWMYNNTYWRLYYARINNMLKTYQICIHLHKKDPSYRLFNKIGIQNTVLENGVIWKNSSSNKKQQEKYILCVSRYTDAKNQRFIVEAYMQSNAPIDLIFIGNSDNKYLRYLKQYEARIRKHLGPKANKKSIHYLVNVPREETEEYIKNSYIIVNGSKTEKYPVTICEAMKAGVPFVSTDVGIVKYLPGGYVVTSEKEMTEKINVLTTDAEAYRSLARAGEEYAESIQSMKANAEKLDFIIQKGI